MLPGTVLIYCRREGKIYYSIYHAGSWLLQAAASRSGQPDLETKKVQMIITMTRSKL